MLPQTVRRRGLGRQTRNGIAAVAGKRWGRDWHGTMACTSAGRWAETIVATEVAQACVTSGPCGFDAVGQRRAG